MPEPITREEVYLNAIATNTGGGDGGSVPEPITRIEQYLNQIADNTAGGGGGGGSSLPAVTVEDNGDVLTVVEGAWAKAAPSGVLVCTMGGNNRLNHTWQEIYDAVFPVVANARDGFHVWAQIITASAEPDIEVYTVIAAAGSETLEFTTDSANGYPVLS